MSSNDDARKPPSSIKTIARPDYKPRPSPLSRAPSPLKRPRPHNSPVPIGYSVPPVYKGPTQSISFVPTLKAYKTVSNRYATPARSTMAKKSASGLHRQRSSLHNEVMSTPRISSSNNNPGRMNYNSGPEGLLRTPDIVTPAPRNRKTTLELKPLWQQLDDEHEQAVLRLRKRDRSGNAISFVRRIGQRGVRTGGLAIEDVDMADANRDRAEIAPILKLRVNGVVQPDEDEPRYRPQRKTVAIRAARKLEFVNASPSGSESESSDEEKSGSSSSSTPSAEEEEEEEEPSSPQSDSDIEMDELAPIPSIILLDYPKRESTTPVRDLGPTSQTEPPDDLIAAVEALTFPVIRMQKMKTLPFLPRNVRSGFLKRCRDLQVPIFTDGRKVSLNLVYEYIAGSRYHTRIDAWLCPLCNLLAAVKTQEMLDCHLRWDHAEVFCEWQLKEQTEEIECWELRLLIPEFISAGQEDVHPQKSEVLVESSSTVTETPQKPPSSPIVTPHTRRLMSPFPSVTLSPPAPKSTEKPKEYEPLHLIPKIEFKMEPTPSSTTTSSNPTPAPSSRSATVATLMGSRSTTAPSHTVASTTSSSTPGPAVPVLHQAVDRPITPPPPDNPLGPAAQFPYLPAKSDYGGPTIEYTCRPSGPSVFDLLGTLPLEPFGLLDWDVIDREEEIWESDDVKPEYKVMQALWMRWIMLHRNEFISNYSHGVNKFVDEYWKIIHRAAGWDALRYWLFILLANRFIDAREMAKVLVHYEGLTGMDNWYD